MDSDKLSFPCPACEGVLRVPHELAGVRGPCPNCGTQITAPNPAMNLPAMLVQAEVAAPGGIPPFPLPTPPHQAGEAPNPSVSQPRPQVIPPQPYPAPAPAPAAQIPLPHASPAETIQPPLQPQPIRLPSRAEPESPSPLPQRPEQPYPIHPEGAIPRPEPEPAPVAAQPISETPNAQPRADPRPPGLSIEPRGAKTNSGGLPIIVKLGIPILLLLGIAAGAIKFWPQIQDKLGFGPSKQAPRGPLEKVPPRPVNPPKHGDGFEFVEEENSKSNTQAITPISETHFSPELEEPESPVEPVEPVGEPTIPKAAPLHTANTEGDEPQREARAVLDQIFAVKTVEELAKLVLAPERVRPLMDAYYANKSPALKSTSIIYETSIQLPDSDHYNHTFFIATEQQPMRFPIAIEDTDDGPKLDWETFIELHDDLLGKFLATPQSEEQTFRVILVRKHFFGGEVPKLGSKDCFRVSTPIAGSEAYAFVDKDSKTARDCEAFEWEMVSFPIVTLRWATPQNRKPYLEITRVVQDSWRANSSSAEIR